MNQSILHFRHAGRALILLYSHLLKLRAVEASSANNMRSSTCRARAPNDFRRTSNRSAAPSTFWHLVGFYSAVLIMSPSKLKLNEPYLSIILIQSASVWTAVFHCICNVIHRLLCKEFWSQGIWLRSGCRSSGSLPVKPEALTHLKLTSALRYHRLQIL